MQASVMALISARVPLSMTVAVLDPSAADTAAAYMIAP